MQKISEQFCFGGIQGVYQHDSKCNQAPMRFSVYVPAQAKQKNAPVLVFLAGLTCTEETFMIKAGAQRLAAHYGIILVSPDTSPRNTGIEGATGDWEFGEGAGFYLNASQEKFRQHFNMHDYVARELPELLAAHFPVDLNRVGMCGHSMGGHGALTLALRNPNRYRSVSAFAPIVAPSQVPWGQRAFSQYLKSAEEWAQFDATELIAQQSHKAEILIDQGLDDKYLASQLRPELFQAACEKSGQKLILRQHANYDHSYWFVQSFIEDHVKHHLKYLF